MELSPERPRGASKGWAATLVGVLAVVVLLAWAAISPRLDEKKNQALFANSQQKSEITARMRIDLLRAVEAEKSAVLADTDQASRDYADLTRQATDQVQAGRQKLQKLVLAEPLADETRLLQEFDQVWGEFVKIDKEILELAVQNTNLKAASLSQGQVRRAMEAMEQALQALSEAESGNPQALKIVRLSGQARASGLWILALQAPHINEASDQGMQALEADMASQDAKLRQSLAEMQGLLGARGQAALGEAQKAYQRFRDLGGEVLRLSRMNSNLKSLDLSLGQKRKIAAQCQEILASLQATIDSRTYKATR